MGYSKGALYAETGSKYGPVTGVFSYAGVKCNGSEVTLDDCPNAGSNSCGSGTGAGVVCESATVVVILDYFPRLLKA